MHVPISFTHAGIYYTGYFARVSGAASAMWHLYITKSDGNYYYGMLIYVNEGWTFHEVKPLFKELEGWFEGYMVGALQ